MEWRLLVGPSAISTRWFLTYCFHGLEASARQVAFLIAATAARNFCCAASFVSACTRSCIQPQTCSNMQSQTCTRRCKIVGVTSAIQPGFVQRSLQRASVLRTFGDPNGLPKGSSDTLGDPRAFPRGQQIRFGFSLVVSSFQLHIFAPLAQSSNGAATKSAALPKS
jgi:hypothetical protein